VNAPATSPSRGQQQPFIVTPIRVTGAVMQWPDVPGPPWTLWLQIPRALRADHPWLQRHLTVPLKATVDDDTHCWIVVKSERRDVAINQPLTLVRCNAEMINETLAIPSTVPVPFQSTAAAQPPDVILPSYAALANGLVDALESRMAAHLNEIRRELAADVANLLKQAGGSAS
jgi:hypothetical protein